MPAVVISDTSRQWANNLNDLRDRWSIRREVATEKEWMPVAEFEKSLANLSRVFIGKVYDCLLECLRFVGHSVFFCFGLPAPSRLPPHSGS